MSRRTAYSMNVASLPLGEARAYATEKLGEDVMAQMPDFDKNYLIIQKKVKAAPGISRVEMPVLEPKDIGEFTKKLNEGSVDIFAPYAKGKFVHPADLSKTDGRWVDLGFMDGNSQDDKVRAKFAKISVGDLKPTQNQIWFENMIRPMTKFGIPGSSSPILKATIIVSSDRYLLDGHHRWAQATLADPSLKVSALYVPLRMEQLLEVGRAYGEAIGNKPKMGAADRKALIRLASSLPKGSRERKAILAGLKTASGPYSDFAPQLRKAQRHLDEAFVELRDVVESLTVEGDVRTSLALPFQDLKKARSTFLKWLSRAI